MQEKNDIHYTTALRLGSRIYILLMLFKTCYTKYEHKNDKIYMNWITIVACVYKI